MKIKNPIAKSLSDLKYIVITVLLTQMSLVYSQPKVPSQLKLQLNNNISQDVIVLYDDATYQFGSIVKHSVLSSLKDLQIEEIRSFSRLPMIVLRFKNLAQFSQFVNNPAVIAVYENKLLYPTLTQSLPLIRQPEVAAMSQTGRTTTVVVLDSGVNYALPTFGGCTAPATPTNCKVVVSFDEAPDDGQLDDNGHGTNVSGIILGVAPDAKLAVIDIFNGATTTVSLVIAGINWAIANQSLYNIVAINMSLGDGTLYTSPCDSIATNPFLTAINNANAAGITTVVSSGNEGFTNGISNPACTPSAVSVGAVYDSNVGGINYGFCADNTTTADQVGCFSNSANFLDILAPGALITSAGITLSGTSQAAPHVSGAIAVLSAAYPLESPASIVSRLSLNGAPITDARNGNITPRIDIRAALGNIDVFLDEDIPFLPPWGLVVLGTGLFAITRKFINGGQH